MWLVIQLGVKTETTYISLICYIICLTDSGLLLVIYEQKHPVTLWPMWDLLLSSNACDS